MMEPPVCLNADTEIEASFLGMGTYIGKDTMIKQTEFIGRFSFIGERCYIGASKQEHIGIGNAMMLKDNSIVWYKNFLKIDHPYKNQKKIKTRIGNDVWIGDNVTIFQGVNIGDGAVVLSGATVISDVPAYAIVCGNPGMINGYRFDRDVIAELLEISWWDYGIDAYKEIRLDEMSTQDIIDYLKKYKIRAVKKRYGQCNFKFVWSFGKWSISYEDAGQEHIQHLVPDI